MKQCRLDRTVVSNSAWFFPIVFDAAEALQLKVLAAMALQPLEKGALHRGWNSVHAAIPAITLVLMQ